MSAFHPSRDALDRQRGRRKQPGGSRPMSAVLLILGPGEPARQSNSGHGEHGSDKAAGSNPKRQHHHHDNEHSRFLP